MNRPRRPLWSKSAAATAPRSVAAGAARHPGGPEATVAVIEKEPGLVLLRTRRQGVSPLCDEEVLPSCSRRVNRSTGPSSTVEPVGTADESAARYCPEARMQDAQRVVRRASRMTSSRPLRNTSPPPGRAVRILTQGMSRWLMNSSTGSSCDMSDRPAERGPPQTAWEGGCVAGQGDGVGGSVMV